MITHKRRGILRLNTISTLLLSFQMSALDAINIKGRLAFQPAHAAREERRPSLKCIYEFACSVNTFRARMSLLGNTGRDDIRGGARKSRKVNKMTTITLTTKSPKRIWLKLQEVESGDEVVAEAVASNDRPEDGESFWWKELSILQLGGIFNGRTEATLTIDDNCRVKEVN